MEQGVLARCGTEHCPLGRALNKEELDGFLRAGTRSGEG